MWNNVTVLADVIASKSPPCVTKLRLNRGLRSSESFPSLDYPWDLAQAAFCMITEPIVQVTVLPLTLAWTPEMENVVAPL